MATWALLTIGFVIFHEHYSQAALYRVAFDDFIVRQQRNIEQMKFDLPDFENDPPLLPHLQEFERWSFELMTHIFKGARHLMSEYSATMAPSEIKAPLTARWLVGAYERRAQVARLARDSLRP
jgi:hypothetical protein